MRHPSLTFSVRFSAILLNLGNDCVESFGIVHRQIGENLAVNLYSVLVKSTHKLRVAKTLQACCRVDTLYPKCAERALLVAAVTVSVCESLLPSILCYCPNILASSEITFSELKNSGSFCL